jgi:hypothetical protein
MNRCPRSTPLLLLAGVGIAVLAAPGCRPVSQSVGRDVSSEPAPHANVPRACPYGHSTVRRTEVLYGYPGRDFRREINTGEVVLGGCSFFAGSPAYLFICKTCEFRMDPVTEDWSRQSADPHTFDRSLSSPILSFPVADKPHLEPVRYVQHFQDGAVTTETVGYWTTEAKDVILSRLSNFAAKQRVELDALTHESPDRQNFDCELSIDNVPAKLRVLWRETREAHVSLEYPTAPMLKLRNLSAAIRSNH